MQASTLLLRWGSYPWARNLWVLIIYLFFLPVMLPSVVPRLTTDSTVRRFPGVWKFLLITSLSPGQVSIPNSFVSPFIFYILFYLLLKTMGFLFGCLVSSASVQKLFCRISSAFSCSFDEFVGEKVISPSYSSTILGPPASFFLLISISFFFLARKEKSDSMNCMNLKPRNMCLFLSLQEAPLCFSFPL